MNKPLGIIAIDLDGTLLDPQGQYSIATRDYLRQLSSRGYAIVLATGRPFRAVKPIYEDLRLNAPVICYNGALAFHPLDEGFPIIEAKFPKETILEIYSLTLDLVDHYMAESSDTVYINAPDEKLDHYFPYKGMNLREGDFRQTLNEDVFTLLFHTDKTEELGQRLEGKFENIGWRSWSGFGNSELFVPGAHKGTALLHIMEQLGLSKEDVYAFGDAPNDMEMLSVAGHPFAMKNNRSPHLLSRFPQTKNPVEEDGVLLTLKELLG